MVESLRCGPPWDTCLGVPVGLPGSATDHLDRPLYVYAKITDGGSDFESNLHGGVGRHWVRVGFLDRKRTRFSTKSNVRTYYLPRRSCLARLHDIRALERVRRVGVRHLRYGRKVLDFLTDGSNDADHRDFIEADGLYGLWLTVTAGMRISWLGISRPANGGISPT